MATPAPLPPRLKVGRAPGNDIVVDHPTVSRLHLELVRNADGSVDVFDKGSAVGTFVLHGGTWVQFEHATVGPDETIRLGEFETTPTLLLVGYSDPFDAVTQRGDKSPRTQRPARAPKPGEPAGPADPQPVPSRASEPAPPSEPKTARSRPAPEPKAPPVEAETRKAGPDERPKQPPPEAITRRSDSAPGPQPATPEPPSPQAETARTETPQAETPQTEPGQVEPAQAEPAPVAPLGTPPQVPTSPPAAAAAGQKSVLVAYLLWFFLGVFGAHRFYLGAMVTAIVMLGLAVVSAGVMAWNTFVGVVPLVLLVLWWLVDGFLTYDTIKKRGDAGGPIPPPE